MLVNQDHSERGYPLFLNLSTRQVSDVVRYDEKILEVSCSVLPSDADMPKDEDPSDREEDIRQICPKY